MKLKKVEDVAKKLGVTERTLLEWRAYGMPWVKIGKSVYILEDSFLKWAKEHEIKDNAQDAPEQDFFGQPIGEVIPPKN